MRHARVLLTILLVAQSTGLSAAGDDPAAGHPDLRALEGRIVEMRTLLTAEEAAMAAQRHAALTMFADRAERFVDDYQPYRGVLPADVQEFPQWYLTTLKERTGYDPSAPLSPWQRQWTQVRQAEHAIHQRYEALRISLRRLERLRDRLRRQLGLEPEDDR